jgi:hypothetical protein
MSETREQTVEMSTPETLTGIFFEPGRTFEALRARPRFLVAALICMAAFMAFYLTYLQRIGYENQVNAEIEMAAQKNDMTPEQKEQARGIQLKPFVKAIRYATPPIVFVIVFAFGALIYFLGAMMMGKRMSYKQALSVSAYSSLPPLLLTMLLNIVILFIRPPTEDAEIARGLGGLVHANLGMISDPVAHPVMTTALASIDLFAFYGLFLAALGLRKIARLSSGAAWTVVLAIWLLGVLLKLGVSLLTKNAMG